MIDPDDVLGALHAQRPAEQEAGAQARHDANLQAFRSGGPVAPGGATS